MVGDALLVREFKVIDIFDAKKTQNETLTSFAKVDSENITYPDDGIPENKETND